MDKLSKIKSNLDYTRLILFWVSRVSGAHLRGFAPGLTHQGCNGGKSLATCRRFDRLGIWTPYLQTPKANDKIGLFCIYYSTLARKHVW